MTSKTTLKSPEITLKTILDHPRLKFPGVDTGVRSFVNEVQLPSRQNDTQTADNCHLNSGRWAQIAIRGLATTFKKVKSHIFGRFPVAKLFLPVRL